MKLLNNIFLTTLTLSTLSLVACGGGGSPEQATYEVTVSNITNGQPLTPLGVVVHRAGYSGWVEATLVSVGLEKLAESGDTTDFLADANANSEVMGTGAGASPFGPGSTQTVSVTVDSEENLQLTVSTMLANTNDAFTGVTNLSLNDLVIGQSKSVSPRVYDAGTEANTETAATMPGPAAGGEGFNAVRDDLDFVSIHAGVVTRGDGLTTSALDETHRWIGPAAIVKVTRTQ